MPQPWPARSPDQTKRMSRRSRGAVRSRPVTGSEVSPGPGRPGGPGSAGSRRGQAAQQCLAGEVGIRRHDRAAHGSGVPEVGTAAHLDQNPGGTVRARPHHGLAGRDIAALDAVGEVRAVAAEEGGAAGTVAEQGERRPTGHDEATAQYGPTVHGRSVHSIHTRAHALHAGRTSGGLRVIGLTRVGYGVSSCLRDEARVDRQPRGPAPRGQRAVSFVLSLTSVHTGRHTYTKDFLSVVPDLTMRGQDDPHGRATIVSPPTVGQLAARVRELAGRPGEWWGSSGSTPPGRCMCRSTGRCG